MTGRGRAGATTLLLSVIVVLAGAVALGLAANATHPAGDAHRRWVPAFGFRVSGRIGQLSPGVTRALELRVTNRRSFALSVHSLTMELTVDARHTRAGCVRRRDFTISGVPRSAFPLTIGPRQTRTLRALGVRRSPTVRMRNLPHSQDACKGARLVLRFEGQALRAVDR